MATESYFFADFMLNPAQRQLYHHGQLLELNSRYLDALILLLQNAGELVNKQQFFAQVWPGVIVSDEALTQCIRTLRRVLGDNATAPRFIETVPKHGYRFIAEVSYNKESDEPRFGNTASQHQSINVITNQAINQQQRFWHAVGFALVGAAMAGLTGGMLYGVLAATQALSEGIQAVSLWLVLLSITTLLSLVAGAAIAMALGAAQVWRPQQPIWSLIAGALGGGGIGAFVSMLLKDMLTLFFGRSPTLVTGAIEGMLIGLSVAATMLLLQRVSRVYRLSVALLPGMITGLMISLGGGVLLAGSLVALAAEFPNAALGQLMLPAGVVRVFGHSSWLHLSAMLEVSFFSAGMALSLNRAQQLCTKAT